MPPPLRTPVKILNCTPEKRSYWSIINDYDPHTAICELIDNPIDIWRKRGGLLNVHIDIDIPNDSITVEDDSGGIPESELHLVVRPGASANLQNENTIGIFGVGSKRSVVALAKKVTITTKARREEKALLLEYGAEWLSDESWDLPCYESPVPCDEGHTIIKLTLSAENNAEAVERLMISKRILVLANSTKHHPMRCVAGRELIDEVGSKSRWGGWIRPVSTHERRSIERWRATSGRCSGPEAAGGCPSAA